MSTVCNFSKSGSNPSSVKRSVSCDNDANTGPPNKFIRCSLDFESSDPNGHVVNSSTVNEQNNKSQSDTTSCNDHGGVTNTTSVTKKIHLKPPAHVNVPPLDWNSNRLEDKNTPSHLSKNLIGVCGVCNRSTAGNCSLLLGCLHSYCSKCILQRKYFNLVNKTSNKKVKACCLY